MSRLPYDIKLKTAARRLSELDQRYDLAYEMNSPFDAGEFSGPALDRQREQGRIGICSALRINGIRAELFYQYEWGREDPLGDWHGRNE